MKISGIRSRIVALPADEPLAGAAENPNGTRPIVTFEVETDEGVDGVGVTYFGGALTGTLRRAIDELGALFVGRGPGAGRGGPRNARRRRLGRARRHLQPCPVGARHRAVGHPRQVDEPAAVEIAGGARDRVPTYASGALMRGLSLDRVVRPPGA